MACINSSKPNYCSFSAPPTSLVNTHLHHQNRQIKVVKSNSECGPNLYQTLILSYIQKFLEIVSQSRSFSKKFNCPISNENKGRPLSKGTSYYKNQIITYMTQ